MTKTNLFAAALVLFLGGYSAGQVLRAEAQAEPKQFTECYAARVWSLSGAEVNSGVKPETVRIPKGWTPVGGSGSPHAVILCR